MAKLTLTETIHHGDYCNVRDITVDLEAPEPFRVVSIFVDHSPYYPRDNSYRRKVLTAVRDAIERPELTTVEFEHGWARMVIAK